MADSWTFAVTRDDLGQSTLVDGVAPVAADGEAVLRVDRVGVTANNVTYAVLGDAMRYWEFFPPASRGLGPQWGLPPLWGFAEVVASTVAGVEVGQRVYGYLPPAGHLLVRPDRVDASGFRDASPHRAELPSPYNAYRSTSGDPAYQPDQEDLLILFRPLFFTSFMLADQVVDNDFYGAESLLVSSASSKTAYAAAFELRGRGPRLVGLTSPGNLAFTRSLGCYDEVVSYDDVDGVDAVPTVYLDLSGAPTTRAALRRHLGDRLVRDIAVGLTNQTPNADAAEEVFFAPVQMRKRSQDWGREGLDRRFTEAWQRFTAVVGGWLDVQVGVGPEALREAWIDVLAGRTPPRVGRVVQL
ncbi:DUF2855 family protein [Micromonospora taraxaci]|uniref:DUF2855 family protein n=1 Tax=Micromonospora taraxaci TaxID=1316803 RepID=UPI00339F9807